MSREGKENFNLVCNDSSRSEDNSVVNVIEAEPRVDKMNTVNHSNETNKIHMSNPFKLVQR